MSRIDRELNKARDIPFVGGCIGTSGGWCNLKGGRLSRLEGAEIRVKGEYVDVEASGGSDGVASSQAGLNVAVRGTAEG